ncbi:sugar ABC transporter ATP-binding protein [Niabella yanshanensis]|uniref:Sugar ABC transporter ATP-binding protein n=1 Tax=Niabella yanshanensis TaxID=577386 RepID=A0ABZ0WAX7_9BACT|nr:sugar ABC transporter ATP-binding protein [Niabella yanshanensis]WQD39236.1 sugar ABC transporter ATP-binding protein [Niabella yanshanensis]
MLIAKNITKKFAGVTALNNVNLELYPGKVNAIVGENGAGKSTLMKILSGVHTQYNGDIIFHGNKVQFNSTKDAEDAGIAIIHQELNLVPHLSIAENIFLGREITSALGILDKGAMRKYTTQLLKKVNLDISPDTLVSKLKVGQQQLVEIAKALHTNAEVIIMDEPTSAITDKEVDNLFEIIDELKEEGKIIVYISHKLKELFQKADTYTVLRDGATIASGNMATITQDELVEKMAGRKIVIEKNISDVIFNEPLLEIKNVNLKNGEDMSGFLVKDASFTLHKGEILGLYGLMGAGRTELIETIFGLHPKLGSGTIQVERELKKINSPARAIASGIMLVPEDRKLQGLCLGLGVKKNISVTVLKQLEENGIFLNARKESALAKDYIEQLNIKTASQNTLSKNLSGGNQQKIVIAKWLAKNPKVLLLDEPTRGIDVGAKSEIYKLIKDLAAGGVGVIVVSSEIPEILALANRVLVMCEGEITADIPIADATEASLLTKAIHKN